MARSSVAFAFDGTNERAARIALKQAASMIDDVSKKTVSGIRVAVSRAIKDGVPPYDAARVIKKTIGLNEQQAQAVFTYRENLINNGLNTASVDNAVSRYADKLLDARARTIARTEIMDALNTGQTEAWEQAQKEGLLSKDAEKEWITADPCDECAAYDGATVPIDEEFPEGDPPLHPNCRCTLGIAAR